MGIVRGTLEWARILRGVDRRIIWVWWGCRRDVEAGAFHSLKPSMYVERRGLKTHDIIGIYFIISSVAFGDPE